MGPFVETPWVRSWLWRPEVRRDIPVGMNPVALLGQARPPAARVSGCQEPPQGGIGQNSRTPSRDGGGEGPSAWWCSRLQSMPGLMQPRPQWIPQTQDRGIQLMDGVHLSVQAHRQTRGLGKQSGEPRVEWIKFLLQLCCSHALRS